MTQDIKSLPLDIPTAHIDDPNAVDEVVAVLKTLHGPDYGFAVKRWSGETRLIPEPGRVGFLFVIEAEKGKVILECGDLVRGPEPAGPYQPAADGLVTVTQRMSAALWPGDVVTVDANRAEIMLDGAGTYFEVVTAESGYRAPRLAMLRHLQDQPGGCAAYDGAFRREAIPPQRPPAEAADKRGVNRVNEHTLDMRIDRHPTPIRHYHGVVSLGDGQRLNHSETAIVIPRAVYGLPEVDQPDRGHIRIYRRPAEDPSDQTVIPVQPGSIVVTPATSEGVMGHCFENCFAMLVAIPGFVAPYNFIEE